jgi:hypothetical protein
MGEQAARRPVSWAAFVKLKSNPKIYLVVNERGIGILRR